MENIYYVYCYYDTRVIPNIPIYIGKGKGNRYTSHFKKTHNQLLAYKLEAILKDTGSPAIVLKLHEKLTNEEALNLEVKYIKEFGRICDDSGSLCNLTLGGENGTFGYKFTGESLKKRQEFYKEIVLKNKQRMKDLRPSYLGITVGTLKVIKDLDIERRHFIVAECLNCGYRQKMRAACLIKEQQKCFRCSNNVKPIKNLDTGEFFLNKKETAKQLNISINTVNQILKGKSRFKIKLELISDLEEIKEYFKIHPSVII